MNRACYARVVSDFVTGDKPVRNERVIRIVERCIIGHLWLTAVWVFALREELIDRIEGVGLNGIVGSENDELRNLGLRENLISASVMMVVDSVYGSRSH